MRLENKRIIVTGAASGMGAASVRCFVSHGARVVAMDVNERGGRTVVDQANEAGPGHAAFLPADVASSASVAQAFEAAVEAMGGLDVLANPAAIQRQSSASDVEVDDWDRMFAINTRGTMLTNQCACRYMRQGPGGSIINFGSISGLRPEPSACAYSASKGAVHSFTRTAAHTWGEYGIRVNAILPAIATPMYDAALARLDEAERTAHHWQNLSSIAMGQAYGDPDRDLGPVMVFLASDDSRFVTGQLLPVDGGQVNVR